MKARTPAHLSEARLQALAEGASPSPQEQTHLEGCLDCAEELAAFAALFEALEAAPLPEVDTAFLGEVMARVDLQLATRAQAHSSLSALWRPLAALSLVSLLALAGAWAGLSGAGWGAHLADLVGSAAVFIRGLKAASVLGSVLPSPLYLSVLVAQLLFLGGVLAALAQLGRAAAPAHLEVS